MRHSITLVQQCFRFYSHLAVSVTCIIFEGLGMTRPITRNLTRKANAHPIEPWNAVYNKSNQYVYEELGYLALPFVSLFASSIESFLLRASTGDAITDDGTVGCGYLINY